MSSSLYRITVISDNKAESPLESEHGFSLWIEAGTHRILLDTGQGNAFRHNAGILGIKINEAEKLVLSHGHYDHTGSVDWVLEKSPHAEVYLNPAAFLPRYSFHGDVPSPVQIPGRAMSAITRHQDEDIHWVNSASRITDGIGLTGPVPRQTPFEDTGGRFYLDPRGEKEDPIRDDLSLWLETDEGLVICTGCCHSGIVNTIKYIIEITGESRIKRIIGGLHLVNAGTERLEKTAAALNEFNIGEIYPCHCTGDNAADYLAETLECPVKQGRAGLVIESS